jgi:hypothetical protein
MTPPSREDLNHLEQNYRDALASISEIKWTGEFPDYPESIVHFMCYILGSVWVNRDPSVSTAKASLSLEPNTMVDIQSHLTAVARSERLSAGSWKQSLEADQISLLIEKAKKLLPA